MANGGALFQHFCSFARMAAHLKAKTTLPDSWRAKWYHQTNNQAAAATISDHLKKTQVILCNITSVHQYRFGSITLQPVLALNNIVSFNAPFPVIIDSLSEHQIAKLGGDKSNNAIPTVLPQVFAACGTQCRCFNISAKYRERFKDQPGSLAASGSFSAIIQALIHFAHHLCRYRAHQGSWNKMLAPRFSSYAFINYFVGDKAMVFSRICLLALFRR